MPNSANGQGSQKRKILVVEDEEKILEGIVDALQMQDFEVVTAIRGDEALSKAILTKPDLIILDIMLPKLSGLDVCENLRQSGLAVPIIFLTAKGREADRILGLEKGADDYMTKPFSLKELIARVHAHLRRRELDIEEVTHQTNEEPEAPAALPRAVDMDESDPVEFASIGDLTIDFNARTTMLGDEEIHVTEKEYQILEILIRNVGRVVEREKLLREAWAYQDLDMETRTVDVTIGKLRHKIEIDPSHPRIIKTKRGKGYIIERIDE